MDDALNSRRVYARKGPSADFKNEFEDQCTLADATAGIPGLFVRSGSLHWMHEGKVVAVGAEVLATIIETHVVTQKAVNKGTEAEPTWVFEFTPYKPTRKDIWNLLSASTLKGGSLIARVREA
jgi:hypothetical protein